MHTSEARAQKAAITRHVSTKLSSLSTKKNTVGYVCEGKQLGKKLNVYVRYVY